MPRDARAIAAADTPGTGLPATSAVPEVAAAPAAPAAPAAVGMMRTVVINAKPRRARARVRAVGTRYSFRVHSQSLSNQSAAVLGCSSSEGESLQKRCQ